MATFSYRALKSGGQVVTGDIQAATRADAFRQLDKQKLQPLNVTAKGGTEAKDTSHTAKQIAKGSVRLNRAQIILFTEEISDLLDAGLQLEPALAVMEQRQELNSLKDLTLVLRQQLREGASFSASLRIASNSFDDLYCNTCAAGELSGALPQILRRQAIHLAAMQELQGRVSQSLIYPAFILFLGLGLVFVFMTYLVPQLTDLFKSTGKALPFTTEVLIVLSHFLSTYWWLLLGVIAGGYFGFMAAVQQPAGRAWWDRTQLRIPLVGDILMCNFYTQLTQTLATMVSNGIPLLNGLRLMRDATKNIYLNGLLTQIVEIVAEGAALSRAMRKVGGFPPMMMDMVVVGEQTGEMGMALSKIGTRYDKELNKLSTRIAAVIPPVIIMVLAGIVGIVMYSMLDGIFEGVNGLKGGTHH